MPAVKSYKRKPSKRQQVQRSSMTIRRLLFLSGFMGVCIFSLWGYFHASQLMTEISKNFEKTMAHIGFRLEDVIVRGRVHSDKAHILSLLELEWGKPLLSLNLAQAKEKLEKISWVKRVQVERKFPNTLSIHVVEKTPVALWQHRGKAYLMDEDGELVETNEPHKYKELLIVTGEKVTHHIGELITLLKQFPDLKPRITGATHLRSLRWDLKLDGSTLLKLPEKEPEKALAYLLNLDTHHRLITQDIMIVDMRLPGQLILRLTPEAIQKQKDKGKDA